MGGGRGAAPQPAGRVHLGAAATRLGAGGGSTLLRVETEAGPLLLKVKHETVWVESALESEPDFPRKPSLSNEHEFLTSLHGEWLPRVRFFDQQEGFQLLALEWLEPFTQACERMDAPSLLTAWRDLRAAIRALFAQGVVHTDLHEGNLCLRGDQIVIIDFEEARRLPQPGSFETSLDVCGENALGNLGVYPERDAYEPRWTCLARLEQVFRDRVRARIPELLERCSYDRDCTFNRDPLQAPDPRVYQSVSLDDLEIEGQRPRDDPRVDVVRTLLRGLARELGPLRHLDIGANLGAFCIAAAREPAVARSVGVEAAPEFVDAARALAFVQGCDAEFHVRVCGRDPLAEEFAGTQVVTLLSVYHHLDAKDAFLADLARLSPEVVIAEMASQDRFYPERGSLAAERDELQRVLGLPHCTTIATSRDYQRPLWVFTRRALSRRLRGECRIAAADPRGLPRRATQRARSVARRAKRYALRALRAGERSPLPDLRDGLTRAIGWLHSRRLPGGGLAVSDADHTAYPEVTGYAIPTLHAWGQHELALELAHWLVAIQNDDGSWSAPGSATPYTFDTGQVLKGLLAADARADGFEEALRRGCDWLLTQIAADGRIDTPTNPTGAFRAGAGFPTRSTSTPSSRCSARPSASASAPTGMPPCARSATTASDRGWSSSTPSPTSTPTSWKPWPIWESSPSPAPGLRASRSANDATAHCPPIRTRAGCARLPSPSMRCPGTPWATRSRPIGRSRSCAACSGRAGDSSAPSADAPTTSRTPRSPGRRSSSWTRPPGTSGAASTQTSSAFPTGSTAPTPGWGPCSQPCPKAPDFGSSMRAAARAASPSSSRSADPMRRSLVSISRTRCSPAPPSDSRGDAAACSTCPARTASSTTPSAWKPSSTPSIPTPPCASCCAWYDPGVAC